VRMTDVRKADPAVRRRALFFLLVGACVGVLLIVGFQRHHGLLRDWILAKAEVSGQRVKLVLLLLAALLLAPLVVLAAYLWSLGERVLRAREYPPPGLRVMRDTPVTTGERAISRGRLLKVLALACGISSVGLGLLLWRVASLLSGRM
jgi:formate hydrogenlyase subunit 3/multisubunit Na+/H+ antiporter MnhD subunit